MILCHSMKAFLAKVSRESLEKSRNLPTAATHVRSGLADRPQESSPTDARSVDVDDSSTFMYFHHVDGWNVPGPAVFSSSPWFFPAPPRTGDHRSLPFGNPPSPGYHSGLGYRGASRSVMQFLDGLFFLSPPSNHSIITHFLFS